MRGFGAKYVMPLAQLLASANIAVIGIGIKSNEKIHMPNYI